MPKHHHHRVVGSSIFLISIAAIVHLAAAAPVYDLPQECTETRMTNAAQVAFESFADTVAACWSRRTPNISAEITSDGMQAHVRPGTKPQCFVEYILQDGQFILGRRLSNNNVCDSSRYRADAILLAINFIWGKGMTTPAANGALRFWWDITAGSVISKPLYDYLQYPVLTPGRSPNDPCSFPVPHVYFFYAMIGANPTLLHQFAAIAPRCFWEGGWCPDAVCAYTPVHAYTLGLPPPKNSKDVNHAKEMAKVLGRRTVNVPWHEKTKGAVYRGSCYPTANPDDDKPGYLLLRGALCQEADRLQSPYIDVGMLVFGNALYVCPAHH